MSVTVKFPPHIPLVIPTRCVGCGREDSEGMGELDLTTSRESTYGGTLKRFSMAVDHPLKFPACKDCLDIWKAFPRISFQYYKTQIIIIGVIFFLVITVASVLCELHYSLSLSQFVIWYFLLLIITMGFLFWDKTLVVRLFAKKNGLPLQPEAHGAFGNMEGNLFSKTIVNIPNDEWGLDFVLLNHEPSSMDVFRNAFGYVEYKIKHDKLFDPDVDYQSNVKIYAKKLRKLLC